VEKASFSQNASMTKFPEGSCRSLTCGNF